VLRRDSDDNRLMRIHVTAAGLEQEQSINAQFACLQNLIFRGVNEVQRAELRRMLQQICEQMISELTNSRSER
jgi:DNA-binding MarR family transcriptional regulator